jgi:hypothetical protein
MMRMPSSVKPCSRGLCCSQGKRSMHPRYTGDRPF